MMRGLIFKIVLAAFLCCLGLGQDIKARSIDIYWREYTGILPADAVPGGYDINNKITYIGQGYVKDRGIITGTIYPGVNKLNVPIHGVQTVISYIKILCSTQKDAFRWIPATADNFHLTMINKYPVRGGFEDSYTLNIARIAFQGEVVVGKIVTASQDYPDKAPMFFVSNGKEQKSDSYEALIYVPKTVFQSIKGVLAQRRK